MTDRPVIRPLSANLIRAHLPAFIAVAADQRGPHWGEENFLRKLPWKWRLSLVAWHDGIPVGYAVVSRRARGHAHLHHFMIRSDYRDRGLGALLMAEMETRARGLGYCELTLKAQKSSASARRFFCRLGYRPISDDGEYILLGKPTGNDPADALP